MTLAVDNPDPLVTPVPVAPTDVVTNRGVPTDVQLPDGGGLPFWSTWTVLDWIGCGAIALVALLLTGLAVAVLWGMLRAWRSPEHLRQTGFGSGSREPELSFSLLVPARHEEEVLGRTLDKLATQRHPDFEIIVIVGDDDPGTERVARQAAARHSSLVSVVVDDSVPKNKPKALNRALGLARGDVIGVFDAGDDVHPGLLRLVDSRLVESDADVVQGGVQPMNFQSSWWSLRTVLEYYFWFRSRLHVGARTRFIPLAGSTVFVRREWLHFSHGWDESCLAENCELGVRLSVAGARMVAAYSPDVVTRVETPGSLRSLLAQRTRRDQGRLQVLAKGDWRGLPRSRQRMAAPYLLSMPYSEALAGVVIPIAVALVIFAKLPAVVVPIALIPLAPILVILVVDIVGLSEFGTLYSRKVRARDYVSLVLGALPYQLFLGAAALRAVVRNLRGASSWEKTTPSGAPRATGELPSAGLTPAGAEQ